MVNRLTSACMRAAHRILASTICMSAMTVSALAQPVIPIVTPDDARTHGLESLRTVVENEGVPLPTNLNRYIADMDAARQLGKALFFEKAVGSDGVQSCASCHFNAGGDARGKNQLSPGLLRVDNDREDDIVGYFNAKANGDVGFEVAGPNAELTRADFPFVKNIGNGANVSIAGDTVSPAAGNSNDVASSQGVPFTRFDWVTPGAATDTGTPIADDVFNVGGVTTRRVEPRNTPTMINAVFNFANFWDGRGVNRFNGENPFGPQDEIARVIRTTGNGKKVVAQKVNLDNASLASQASGPPLSHFEMSFGDGDNNFRIFPQIGRKLASRRPLQDQYVHPEDSLLAGARHPSGLGMDETYEQLIRRAFKPEYWEFAKYIKLLDPTLSPAPGNQQSINAGLKNRIVNEPGPDAFSLLETNFSFFYSVSVMLYEATLVSDETPFDNWMRGVADPGFGPAELAGLNVFVDKGKCVACHVGPELTGASIRNVERQAIEPMIMGDGRAALYDTGFYNIGVTPTVDDLGRGAPDPFGRPLAFARQFAFQALGIMDIPFGITGSPIANLICDPNDPNTDLDPATCDAAIIGAQDEVTGAFIPVCRDLNGDGQCAPTDELLLPRVAVDGAFKTPGLRNVSETAPYFHNGSAATLLEVVQFYDRGGNFCAFNAPDLDAEIGPLGLTDQEEVDLVAFLLSLTDRRVVNRAAPFDNPEFPVPNGHPTSDLWVADAGTGQGADALQTIDATGAAGGAPLPKFLGGVDHFSANPVAGGVCNTGLPTTP